MNVKGWFAITIYFLIGCSSLALVGYGATKLFSFGTTTAKAQNKPSAQAPAKALPGPEDIPIESTSEMPAAPEEESAIDAASGQRVRKDLGILEGIIEQYDYQGSNKRDPFAPYILPRGPGPDIKPLGPVTELERYELEQLRLVGIIWGVPKPKALFLDPNQKTYVVFNKTRIGRNSGYVAEIREGEVVVIEAFNNEGRFSYQPRIIKLQRE